MSELPVTNVLVDTSLLIEMQKRPGLANPVKDQLSGYRFRGASSYSKLEYKRAWIQRWRYIHDATNAKGVSTVADVHSYITERLSKHPDLASQLHTTLQQMNVFFHLMSGNINDSTQLVRLRRHSERMVLDGARHLKRSVTGFFYGTGCFRAEEPVARLSNGSLRATISKCKPEEINCKINEFFQDHRDRFESIADYIDELESPSGQLQRMRDHIREALTHDTHLCDGANCSKLADAIIALDGIDMDTFAANNDAEWEHISSVLGKPLINPVLRPEP